MLAIQNLKAAYDGDPVLHGIDLTIPEGEILCLLGPSGCGKTTLLRSIAGLEEPTGGDVHVDGESVLRVPVHQRDFGLMFQDLALFPHMDVLHNVTFGLRMQGISRSQRDVRAREMLELVGMTGFADRDVTQLSGGERQRVALARALAPNPRLLMLDEPLGSLDAALRESLIVELRDLIKRVGLTAIYVTHDQSEAFAIADRVVVMNVGHVEQAAPPHTLYTKPKTAFTARFLGLDNLIPVNHCSDGSADTPLGTFMFTQDGARGSVDYLLLHPDGLRLAAGEARLEGRVSERVYRGGRYRLRVHVEDGIGLTVYVAAVDGVPDVSDLIGLDYDETALIPLTDTR